MLCTARVQQFGLCGLPGDAWRDGRSVLCFCLPQPAPRPLSPRVVGLRRWLPPHALKAELALPSLGHPHSAWPAAPHAFSRFFLTFQALAAPCAASSLLAPLTSVTAPNISLEFRPFHTPRRWHRPVLPALAARS